MPLSLSLGLGLSSRNTGGGYSVAQFIADMTEDGQWSTLDAAYVFDPASGAYEDLTSNNRDLTVTATVTQVPGRGVRGDGVTGKLLGLGNANALANATQNDCAVTIMATKAGNQTAHFGRNAGNGELLMNAGPLNLAARLHSSSTTAFAVNNSVGVSTVWREPGVSGTAYAAKDASYLGSAALASLAPTATALAILNGSTSFCTDTVFSVLIGKGITQAQALRRNAWLKQLAQARGWRPIPTITDMGARSSLSARTHPDGAGSTTGKGITATGLAADGSIGLWVGNDGRGEPLDTSHDCGVRYYPDASDLATFTDLLLAAPGSALKAHFDGLGINTATYSVQGVACASATQIVFVALNTAGSNTRVVLCDNDGTNVSSWDGSGAANGICFDPVQGLAGVLLSNIQWRNAATGALTFRTGGTRETRVYTGNKDHIWTDPTGAWALITGGANGVPGTVEAWSLINEWGCPVPIRKMTLTDTLAVEGAAILDGVLYVNSDQYFHTPSGGAPALNMLQAYSADGLLDPF